MCVLNGEPNRGFVYKYGSVQFSRVRRTASTLDSTPAARWKGSNLKGRRSASITFGSDLVLVLTHTCAQFG